jgi:hypothetical protein
VNFDQTLYIVIPSPTKLQRWYSNATVHPSFCNISCEHSRVNMVQWISTNLGTQVILTKIWHPIDFQGQRSRSQLNFEFFRGLTMRGCAMLCVALVLCLIWCVISSYIYTCDFQVHIYLSFHATCVRVISCNNVAYVHVVSRYRV